MSEETKRYIKELLAKIFEEWEKELEDKMLEIVEDAIDELRTEIHSRYSELEDKVNYGR